MWIKTKLDEICTIKGRIGYRGYTKKDLVKEGDGAISLSPSNIIDDKLIFKKKTYISWKKYEESPEIMVNPGDIIFCKTASIGKMALIDSLPEKATLNPQLVVLKNIKCLNKFLFYSMMSANFQKQIKDIIGGTAIPTLSQKNLGECFIFIPPHAEQQNIVAKLDATFVEIDKILDIEFKKKKTTKFLIEKINDNIFNKLKNNSKSVKLSSIIKFENGDRGKNYPSKKYQLGVGIPFINAGDLSLDGEITQKGMVYISKDRFNLLGAGKIELDDILFCLRGSLGKCALNKTYKQGAIASSLVIMRPEKKKILPKYLLAYLRSGLIKELIRNTASGTAQPNLSAKTVSNYEIPLPSIEIQELVLNKIEILKEEYFKLRKITSQKRDELGKFKSSILLKKLSNKAA